MADGIFEVLLEDENELQDLRDALPRPALTILQSSVLTGGMHFPAGCRLVSNTRQIAIKASVKIQLEGWTDVSLSAFGQELRASSHCTKPLTARELAARSAR